MEVALPMKGRRDQWKEQQMQKWDVVLRNVCCETGGGAMPFMSNFFVCVLYKII